MLAKQLQAIYFAGSVWLSASVKAYQSTFLFILGVSLLSLGVVDLGMTQQAPEPAQAAPAEGAFAIPAIPLIPLPPEGPGIVAPAQPLEANYDDTLSRNATANLFRLIEGSFGALIMVAAGLGAIIAAAFGAYKAAISLLVVAVAAFILRALVSLFFGTNYEIYDVEFVG